MLYLLLRAENPFHNLLASILISDTLEIVGVLSVDQKSVGKRSVGKLYDRMTKAKADRDIGAFNSCYHDDWEFKFHSSGRIVRRGDNTDEQTLERWDTFKVENDRCLFENEGILVTHSIVHFPNGSNDAVMMVHMKKDGLLWRTETGSTPMPKE